MAYKIVFIDIDGTLVNEEKKIPHDAKLAINELKKRNIPIVLATGRAPYFFSDILAELNLTSYISFNGSYVVHEKEEVYKKPIPIETLEKLEQIALKNDHPLVFQGSKECCANHQEHAHIIESFQSLKLNAPSYRKDFWKEADIYQCLLFCEEKDENLYEETFSTIHFVRWHPLSMDVIPTGGSKAAGIVEILNRLNIDPQEAVAFGDGLNDKEMLSYVGMGIAMGNAHEEVIPFAKMVTKHVNEGGLSYGLKEIGLI
ncbi:MULTISPECIES: Cof-type HAD-IIB family hydrolase [unclassified Bacillus (in: firmicutes)]|uniref:Cof-type HAD-IIB family hydrolase n=1 Tax=Bacillaceae TaxID=186817 RepID=UPI0004E1D0D7|nr:MULTISPECIES: Cof-type HAD-IIB family hydrolase [unclassified Bacillus (in: firmicutes)]CAI9389849.1 Putative bifunctional phosphatase/peptidyl-prolyl cis-trans isomerase [Bacillus sp. T2.9-1]